MRILYHCEDRAGAAMAGPAIRAVELCRRLAVRHQVTLACPGASELPEQGRPFAVAELHPGQSLRRLLAAGAEGDAGPAEVLITQGFGFAGTDLPRLGRGVRLVLDLYDPVLLELLARAGAAASPEQRLHLAAVRLRLLYLLRRADHVLCASERQRSFWLGWLGAAGRLLPDELARDPEARQLVALVPFGTAAAPAVDPGAVLACEALLRAAAGPEALPLLWWGGLWDWMDPVTAVRAVALLRQDGLRAGLVLPAGNRPGAAPMAAAALAEEEARRHGLWGRGVGRLPQWVPYADRAALLRGAAVAVSCHRPSLEAELSFRTRLLDCVWAGLPVACTGGDELSSRAAAQGWARTVRPGDPAALAEALAALLQSAAGQAARAAAAVAAPDYTWERSAERLLELLEQPVPPRPRRLPLPELRGARTGELLATAARKLVKRLRPGQR